VIRLVVTLGARMSLRLSTGMSLWNGMQECKKGAVRKWLKVIPLLYFCFVLSFKCKPMGASIKLNSSVDDVSSVPPIQTAYLGKCR